ncbi:MAG: Re/Si-specific NAD(P)(+) transhydrogenase subunit alpha [Phycisphaerae bacterium]|jgi:NAD(P) transhydrogenase subunit alpha|nr:Re/Si-specific NAD(P)(+) transhydrogenase subunit alpha [Phycisphaerae bacterium]HRS29287.1 Re/Si-specific NAD(P)(+) transhydrogenase subunit alpha [Phycisphaerae bacterium]
MKIAVPKETRAGEQRVALVPESVKKLVKAGAQIAVESGAGSGAFFSDAAYSEAGATIAVDAPNVYAEADFVLKVQPPGRLPDGRNEVELLRPGSLLLCTLNPTRNLDVVQKLAAAKVTAFSTDAIPRTTRAQTMDTLSSMANIAGYKAVLIAAVELPKYLPMFMTAAGTIFAAKVFVIGAGVAGLQAIATAKRLGAIVTATDVRRAVAEQIQSLGAKFVGVEGGEDAEAAGGYARELTPEYQRQHAQVIARTCAASDVVITTALIGGVKAPKLITAEMVAGMQPGSVIVDVAAEAGGNCELTKPGETVIQNGVKIVGPLNLPSSMPRDASVLYSRNLTAFVLEFWKDGRFDLVLTDEIIAGALITHAGEVVHGPTKTAIASEGRQ